MPFLEKCQRNGDEQMCPLSRVEKKKIPIIHHHSINVWKVVRGGKKLLVDNDMITESNTVDIIHFYFSKPLISLHMIFSLTSSYSVIDIIQQYGGTKEMINYYLLSKH